MAKSEIYEVLHCGVASRPQFLLLTYVIKFWTVCSRTPLIRHVFRERYKFYRQDYKRKLKNCSFMFFAVQVTQGRREQQQQQQQRFEGVVGFLLGAPNKVVHESNWRKICMIYEIKWNANLMQLGNFIGVFLARHVSGTYAIIRSIRCWGAAYGFLHRVFG